MRTLVNGIVFAGLFASVSYADYLEVHMRATTMSPAKYYEYTAYFDLDKEIEYPSQGAGIATADYAFGGRPFGDGIPFIAIEDERLDRYEAQVRLFLNGHSLEFECVPSGLMPRSFFKISDVDEQVWDVAPVTLPRDLQAYRLLPDYPNEASISMERPGTPTIQWTYPDNDHNIGNTVFYTVRIVDELPESAFSPLDFNRDGQINFFDVSRFVELYLEATN